MDYYPEPSIAETKVPIAKKACQPCADAKRKCSDSRPCPRCVRLGIAYQCVERVRGLTRAELRAQREMQQVHHLTQHGMQFGLPSNPFGHGPHPSGDPLGVSSAAFNHNTRPVLQSTPGSQYWYQLHAQQQLDMQNYLLEQARRYNAHLEMELLARQRAAALMHTYHGGLSSYSTLLADGTSALNQSVLTGYTGTMGRALTFQGPAAPAMAASEIPQNLGLPLTIRDPGVVPNDTMRRDVGETRGQLAAAAKQLREALENAAAGHVATSASGMHPGRNWMIDCDSAAGLPVTTAQHSIESHSSKPASVGVSSALSGGGELGRHHAGATSTVLSSGGPPVGAKRDRVAVGEASSHHLVLNMPQHGVSSLVDEPPAPKRARTAPAADAAVMQTDSPTLSARPRAQPAPQDAQQTYASAKATSSLDLPTVQANDIGSSAPSTAQEPSSTGMSAEKLGEIVDELPTCAEIELRVASVVSMGRRRGGVEAALRNASAAIAREIRSTGSRHIDGLTPSPGAFGDLAAELQAHTARLYSAALRAAVQCSRLQQRRRPMAGQKAQAQHGSSSGSGAGSPPPAAPIPQHELDCCVAAAVLSSCPVPIMSVYMPKELDPAQIQGSLQSLMKQVRRDASLDRAMETTLEQQEPRSAEPPDLNVPSSSSVGRGTPGSATGAYVQLSWDPATAGLEAALATHAWCSSPAMSAVLGYDLRRHGHLESQGVRDVSLNEGNGAGSQLLILIVSQLRARTALVPNCRVLQIAAYTETMAAYQNTRLNADEVAYAVSAGRIFHRRRVAAEQGGRQAAAGSAGLSSSSPGVVSSWRQMLQAAAAQEGAATTANAGTSSGATRTTTATQEPSIRLGTGRKLAVVELASDVVLSFSYHPATRRALTAAQAADTLSRTDPLEETDIPANALAGNEDKPSFPFGAIAFPRAEASTTARSRVDPETGGMDRRDEAGADSASTSVASDSGGDAATVDAPDAQRDGSVGVPAGLSGAARQRRGAAHGDSSGEQESEDSALPTEGGELAAMSYDLRSVTACYLDRGAIDRDVMALWAEQQLKRRSRDAGVPPTSLPSSSTQSLQAPGNASGAPVLLERESAVCAAFRDLDAEIGEQTTLAGDSSSEGAWCELTGIKIEESIQDRFRVDLGADRADVCTAMGGLIRVRGRFDPIVCSLGAPMRKQIAAAIDACDSTGTASVLAGLRAQLGGAMGALTGLCPMAGEQEQAGAGAGEAGSGQGKGSRPVSPASVLNLFGTDESVRATTAVPTQVASSATSSSSISSGSTQQDSLQIPALCSVATSLGMVRSRLPICSKLAARVIVDLAEQERQRVVSRSAQLASAGGADDGPGCGVQAEMDGVSGKQGSSSIGTAALRRQDELDASGGAISLS